MTDKAERVILKLLFHWRGETISMAKFHFPPSASSVEMVCIDDDGLDEN